MKSLGGVKRRRPKVIHVFRSPLDPRRGRVRAGSTEWPCALGRSGLVRAKREGDGGTPVGRLRVLQAFYRADRLRRPRIDVPVRAIGARDGWCDDPGSRAYNRPVRLPFAGSHERLRRDDHLYDLVLDLSWNRGPIRRGAGSAIFLHVAGPGFSPTEGCVAVARHRIVALAGLIGRDTIIDIRG